MSELCGFVYNKGHQKSRETTREIWRSEGELAEDQLTLSSSRNNLYFEGSLPLLRGHVMVTKKT